MRVRVCQPWHNLFAKYYVPPWDDKGFNWYDVWRVTSVERILLLYFSVKKSVAKNKFTLGRQRLELVWRVMGNTCGKDTFRCIFDIFSSKQNSKKQYLPHQKHSEAFIALRWKARGGFIMGVAFLVLKCSEAKKQCIYHTEKKQWSLHGPMVERTRRL